MNLTASRNSIVKAMLTSTAFILTKSVTESDLNDEIETWALGSTPYPCRVTLQSDRSAGGEEDFGDADIISGQVKYIIKLPWDCPVTRFNRLRVDNNDYEITATNDEHTDRLLLNVWATRLS
jgi:hypothetical protein